MPRRAVAHNAHNFADNSIDRFRVQTCNARSLEQVRRDEDAAACARDQGKSSLC